MLILLCWVSSAHGHDEARAVSSRAFAHLCEDYGVEVHHDLSSPFLSSEWSPAIAKLAVTPIRPEHVELAERALAIALEKYEPATLAEHLRCIVVCSSLRNDAFEYSATYDRGVIYLGFREPTTEFGALLLASHFHHEFSSVLMMNGVIDIADWRRRCARTEGDESVDVRSVFDNAATAMLPSSALLDRGFLCEYATRSSEEDLNVFTSVGLTRPEVLDCLERGFPRLAEKRACWEDLLRPFLAAGAWNDSASADADCEAVYVDLARSELLRDIGEGKARVPTRQARSGAPVGGSGRQRPSVAKPATIILLGL